MFFTVMDIFFILASFFMWDLVGGYIDIFANAFVYFCHRVRWSRKLSQKVFLP